VVIPGEVLARIPEDKRGKVCICRQCAEGAARETLNKPSRVGMTATN
jgi:hypothetical protein